MATVMGFEDGDQVQNGCNINSNYSLQSAEHSRHLTLVIFENILILVVLLYDTII